MILHIFLSIFLSSLILPDYPNHCYVASTNYIHNVGDTWPMEGECGSIYCSLMGDAHYLTYLT